MAVQFRPDVASAGSEIDTFTRKAKVSQNHPLDANFISPAVAQYARTEVYDTRGVLRLSAADSGTLLDAYLETKKVIKEQLAQFFGSQVIGAPELGETEAAGPLEIPEYWNVENTARRIFAIALLGYQEGSDRVAFADRAIAMIKPAYREVGSALGFELPELVLDTRQAVLGALEQFRGGAALSEISFE